MRQPILIMTLLLFACGEKKAAVENMAQTLRNEAAETFATPPQADREVDPGTKNWESDFEETSVSTDEGVTTRAFRLVIRNRAASPQKFSAIVEYLDDQRNVVRTRTVPPMVIAPYSDRTIEDKLAVPQKVGATIASAAPKVEVLPWEEE
jgi:hypothetical protein